MKKNSLKSLLIVLCSLASLEGCNYNMKSSVKSKTILSKATGEDVSEARLTLALMDSECSHAYDSWLSFNEKRIQKTFESGSAKIHLMKKLKETWDDEYVFVIDVDKLDTFKVDTFSFKEEVSKLLIFGERSKKKAERFKNDFGKTIDVSDECRQLR